MENKSTNIVDVVLRYTQEGLEKANAQAKKFNQGIAKSTRAFQDANKTGKRRKETIARNTLASSGFSQVMGMNQEQLGKFNKQGYKFTSLGGRVANRFRMAAHGAKGFRMEMLGVMFFGMSLQRTFTGLMKTSMEWMGITEILSMALGVLFLPIAELVLEWALKFLNVVLGLSENTKMVIGVFVLAGAILGGFLFILGTLALGIGSLILVFGAWLIPIGLILAAITAIAAVIALGVFGSFGKEAEDANSKLAEFGFTKDTITKVIEGVGTMLKRLVEKITEKLPEILEKGKEIGTKIIDGLVEIAPSIGRALEIIITEMSAWISDNFDKMVDIGLTIGKHIAVGVINGLANFIRDNFWAVAGGILGGTIGGIFGGPAGLVAGGTAGAAIGSKFGRSTPIEPSAPGSGYNPFKKQGEINLNVTNNMSGYFSDKREIERMLEESQKKTTEELRMSIQT